MVEKIRPVYQNDPVNAFIAIDQFQRSTETNWKKKKHVFILAIGQSAITEMTNSVWKKELSSLPLDFTHFSDYTSFLNRRNSTVTTFNLERKPGESATDTWKRILEIVKNCEFETLTAAELLASNFVSVIWKTRGDNDMKKKIKNVDMSVGAITDTIREFMYEKTNEFKDSDEETNIKHVSRMRTYRKHEKENQNNFKKQIASDAVQLPGTNNITV